MINLFIIKSLVVFMTILDTKTQWKNNKSRGDAADLAILIVQNFKFDYNDY